MIFAYLLAMICVGKVLQDEELAAETLSYLFSHHSTTLLQQCRTYLEVKSN